jgi:hypothetical protein
MRLTAGSRIGPYEIVARSAHRAFFSASANGVLAYVNGGSVALGLTWLNRTGKRRGNVGDPGILGRLRISPDGKSRADRQLVQTVTTGPREIDPQRSAWVASPSAAKR